MTGRHELTLEQFRNLEPHLPGRVGSHGGVARDNLNFLNAVLHINKTGVAWRDLPERFGKWDTVYHRFNQWSKKGVWKRLFELMQDPDLEWLFVDSTVVRAHQHAAGMNTGGEDQDLGRSVGGFSTKLHMAVDSLGNPVAMHLSPGQAHDSKHALDVIGDLKPEVAAMDKAYDSEPLMAELRSRGIEPCIPPKKQTESAGVRSTHLQGTEVCRVHVQLAEAVPSDCHTVRKDGAELPQYGPVRRHDGLVPLDRIKAKLQRSRINTA